VGKKVKRKKLKLSQKDNVFIGIGKIKDIIMLIKLVASWQKLALTIAFMCLSFNLMAIEGFDECKILEEKILENHSKYSLDEPRSYEFNSIYFQRDIPIDGSPSKYVRNDSNNVLIESVLKSDAHFLKYAPKTEVIKVNTHEVKSLTDEEIDSLLASLDDKEKIYLQVTSSPNELRSIILNKKEFMPSVLLESEFLSISNINSSQSTYSAKILNKMEWSHDLLALLAKDVQDAVPSSSKFDPATEYWVCTFSQDEWKSMRLFDPVIRYLNLVNEDNEERGIQYLVTYMPKEYTGEGQDSLKIKKFQTISGTFKGQFNFNSFPFDSQRLSFNYFIADNGGYSIYPWIINDGGTTNGFNNVALTDWKKKSIDYEYFHYNDLLLMGEKSLGLQHVILVDRNYHYYLIKIFLPIIIILLVAWSCFLIPAIELEARLTVSIVCLLSLIAYTFVIDKDLPKLSYLTIMDYWVLLSYICAAIPTFESIYVRRLVKKYPERAKIVDFNFLVYAPILYSSVAFVVVLYQLSNSENIVNALAFIK
jgi:hypothetical protein